MPSARRLSRSLIACFARACEILFLWRRVQAGILAFSLVMLNVDAHNANIAAKKKMTEAQYIRNLKGVCKDGLSPDERMVKGYYARITRYEWSVEERHNTPSVHEG